MHRWYWKAIYHDGSFISEIDINPATGREWSSEHVELVKLKAFVLEPKDNTSKRVILQVQPGEVPYRFWRKYLCQGNNNADTCWVLGIKKDSFTFYAFFRPDGSVILSSDSEGSEFTL